MKLAICHTVIGIFPLSPILSNGGIDYRKDK
jgi:hypothetical protein